MENNEIRTVYILKEFYYTYDEDWEDVIGVFSNRDSAYSAQEYLIKQNSVEDTRFEIIEYELSN